MTAPPPPASADDLRARFGAHTPLIGMVHLLPLPGSPGWSGPMNVVLKRVEHDVRALVEGGVDGVLVENIGDRPFHPDTVPPATVAAMTRAVALAVELADDRPVGVNVLRNDAAAGLAVAAATGAQFLRINIHTGSMFTDQGLIHGRAHETLRLRAQLAPDVLLLADILVKHAVAPPGLDAAQHARDTRARGMADALVVSGPETGRAADPLRLDSIRRAVPDAPIWIGSGLDPDSGPRLLRQAHGGIVGTVLHRDGDLNREIDIERVRRFVGSARE
ncbi:MAG: BtpA/SgcQ family protein [Gemmatimonadota bacterium]